MLWTTTQTKLLETAKYPQKEKMYLIEPKPEPTSITEEGKYGKQTMYIVKSREAGMLKLNQWQFLKVCEMFNGKFDSAVTVQF